MQTNKLVLGTVQMGLPYGINNSEGQIDIKSSFEILDAAFENGIRCLDTAELYGTAHDVIGQYHQTHPTRIFDVITKLPHELNADIESKIDTYISQMRVSRLTALLFHSYKNYKENAGLIKKLSTYKKSGKIQYLGVSVYTNSELEDVIEDDQIDIIQLPFNLFDNRNLRGDMLIKAKNKGKIIHTRSTFLQGLFFASSEKENPIVCSLAKELAYINQLSADHKIPLQKIALNYALQQPQIDNVLIGVDNIAQLNRNISDADCSLNKEIIDKINKIFIKEVDLLNPSLWGQ